MCVFLSLSIYIYICVCLYVCMYVYYMYDCVYIYIYTCTHTSLSLSLYIYIYMYMHGTNYIETLRVQLHANCRTLNRDILVFRILFQFSEYASFQGFILPFGRSYFSGYVFFRDAPRAGIISKDYDVGRNVIKDKQ